MVNACKALLVGFTSPCKLRDTYGNFVVKLYPTEIRSGWSLYLTLFEHLYVCNRFGAMQHNIYSYNCMQRGHTTS